MAGEVSWSVEKVTVPMMTGGSGGGSGGGGN